MSVSPTAPIVLLVEDQPLLALVMQAALEESGYEVVTAHDGTSALERLDGGLRPSALITDIRLGSGPNGWQLAHSARRTDPELPVIFVSGDSGQQFDDEPVRGSVLLQKPISAPELLSALRALC